MNEEGVEATFKTNAGGGRRRQEPIHYSRKKRTRAKFPTLLQPPRQPMLPRLGLVRPHLRLLQPLRQPVTPPNPRRLPLGLGGSRLQLLRPCMRLQTQVQLLQALELPARLPTTTSASSRAPLQRFPSPLSWRMASSWLRPKALLRTRPWTFPTMSRTATGPCARAQLPPELPFGSSCRLQRVPKAAILVSCRRPSSTSAPISLRPASIGLGGPPSPDPVSVFSSPCNWAPTQRPCSCSQAPLGSSKASSSARGGSRPLGAPFVQTPTSQLCSWPPSYPLPTLAFSFGQAQRLSLRSMALPPKSDSTVPTASTNDGFIPTQALGAPSQSSLRAPASGFLPGCFQSSKAQWLRAFLISSRGKHPRNRAGFPTLLRPQPSFPIASGKLLALCPGPLRGLWPLGFSPTVSSRPRLRG